MSETQSSLISRSEGIVNLEMPFSSLKDFVTPNESFYVRCHFPIPEIAAKNWRLRVEGAVTTPLEIGYAELEAMPQQTLTAAMECAGNGRAFLQPKVKGVQWGLGAIGNAQWSGVSLGAILRRAGVKAKAVEVILQGADQGEIKDAPKPPGSIHYARSLPMAKAQSDVLLALRMNEKPLTPSHGYPLRAVVPGWFGMASVKWLERIIVSEEPFNGYYQSIDYTFWKRRDGNLPSLHSLGEMPVKAQIARPEPGEVISPNETYRIHGAAWGGEATVAKVELSFDDGKTWAKATLLDEALESAWRFWEFKWKTPAQPGKAKVIARATDSAGRTQPAERIADYGTYMVNHWLPIEVEVR
ncbi:MAG: sulfite oxidase [Verrucomicrobiota bacterium]|nr:sulfite oxidase [Verrucomicrobiota bacterium]